MFSNPAKYAPAFKYGIMIIRFPTNFLFFFDNLSVKVEIRFE